MAQVSVTINGRAYQVACDDGQEEHLRKLAEHLDEKVQGIAGQAGPVGEQRLLVMAGLMVADELFEAFTRIHTLSPGGGAEAQGTAAAQTLDDCAQRIEALAARLVEA